MFVCGPDIYICGKQKGLLPETASSGASNLKQVQHLKQLNQTLWFPTSNNFCLQVTESSVHSWWLKGVVPVRGWALSVLHPYYFITLTDATVKHGSRPFSNYAVIMLIIQIPLGDMSQHSIDRAALHIFLLISIMIRKYSISGCW